MLCITQNKIFEQTGFLQWILLLKTRKEVTDMEKCNIKALAVAIGALWSFSVLLLGWMAAFGWGREIVTVLASLYLGYAPTFLGGIVGAIWAFIDGAIAGAIIAWVYNLVAQK
ncbi:MAG: bacteriophage holin [Desulfobaccales bacterium]